MAEGYFDFVAGVGLSAANLEDYCESQGIMRFASAAARDTALALIKTEGMFAYLKDVNTLTMYTGTGTTWSTMGAGHGVLPTWTPVVTQSGTVTATVVYADYQRLGRMVWGSCLLSITGTGSASNVIQVALPFNIDADWISDYAFIGRGGITDTSASLSYQCDLAPAGASTFKFRADNTATPATFLGLATMTAALANTDNIGAHFFYQAASDA